MATQKARLGPGLLHTCLAYGGGKGTRTPGLNAASVALSQLSYTPTPTGTDADSASAGDEV